LQLMVCRNRLNILGNFRSEVWKKWNSLHPSFEIVLTCYILPTQTCPK
jgi:hypothetical protein